MPGIAGATNTTCNFTHGAASVGRSEGIIMDAARVVRTVDALFVLALDQRGKPEGETALSRGREWLQRHAVSPRLLSRRANIALATLAPDLLPPQPAAPPPPPPPPPRPATPPRKSYRTWRDFVDVGTCAWCGERFARGKNHQGPRATFCSPDCHKAKRTRDSRERMRERRAAARGDSK